MSDDRTGDTAVAVPTGPAGPAVDVEPAPARSGRTDIGALLTSAVVAAVVGLALWAAVRSSQTATVVVVALVQAALIQSWTTGLRVPGRIGGTVVCALAAAGADVLAVVHPGDQLGVLVPPLGLLVLAIFVAQLFRGVMRVRVVESVSDIAVLGIAVIALASVLVLQDRILDPATPAASAAVPVVLVVAAALTFGALGDVLAPLPRFDPVVERGLVGVLLAAVAGAFASYLVVHDAFGFGPKRGAFLGAALGVVVALVAVGSSFLRHVAPEPTPAGGLPTGTEDDDPGGPDGADTAERRSLAALAAEEILVEADAARPADSTWAQRLAPVAAVLWAFALSTPVGYLLVVALGG